MESDAGGEVASRDTPTALGEPEAALDNPGVEEPTSNERASCSAYESCEEGTPEVYLAGNVQLHMQCAAADGEACGAVAIPVQQYLCSDLQQTTGTLSQLKELTFSGPPYVPKAKPYTRIDYSHSNTRLMKIAYDNQKLVERLTSISRQEPNWAHELSKTSPSNTASSAVNRRKAAMTIAQENHALYQRLVAIKPSKDISRETLETEHRKNKTYRINCATFKPKSPAHTIH